MPTNWADLIDKLLYQRGLTQVELSELLGVDPGTVSRWKRKSAEPSVLIQRQLKEMLFKDSPMIDPQLIRMLPNRVFIAHYNDLTKLHALSETLAADYGMTVEEILAKPTNEWIDPKVLGVLKAINREPMWKSREAAGFSSVYARSDGTLWKSIGLCFGDRRYLYVNIGKPDEDEEIGYRILTPETDRNTIDKPLH